MSTVNQYPFLPPNVTVFEEADRETNGIYEIGSRQIHIFPFEIEPDGILRVPIMQLGRGGATTFDQSFRQSLSIRAWVSEEPNGIELFFRFHPGTAGITHLFYDRNLDPPPVPEEGNLQRSQFSQISFQPKDILIALIPGVYYYNVLNMEGSPSNDLDNTPNSYKIGFVGPNPVCPPPYPEGFD